MNLRELQVVAACLASRFGASTVFPLLQQQLDKSVEFSTPVTSYRSLQEGVFLIRNDFPLYSGGVVHHAPLLVALMSAFSSKNMVSLLYACADTMIAFQLIAMAKCFSRSPLPSWVPGALYVINPLVLLSTVSKSSVVFSNLAISTALLSALQGNSIIAAMAIAVAGYLSLYPLLLVVPMLALLQKDKLKTVFITAATLTALLLSSYKINDENWNYLFSTYGVIITFSKIIPNLGLWWYFFVELFEMFIPFFKAVFNLFVVSCIIPFSLRFHKQPFYAFILCLSWITLTKSYPTLGDGGFLLSFVPFFRPLYGYFRYSVISTLLFIHVTVLSPIFYHLWVDLGSGNSNFFYAISLVYALGLATVLVDLVWAMLRIEYDKGTPNLKLKMTPL
ncbi:LANO_0H00452g1_1 [Lachancea nothofagi CBS 11611]|uniref:LANO_0H00452g1_1 n=1 Tax=Lachancea nothofagi CBS 11611 TaxID=1266666 RepID=A0A1G4KKX4_9SACH|nr:LANO_0H00452g1_1 [Lachancea nothofagi CBS 11611]